MACALNPNNATLSPLSQHHLRRQFSERKSETVVKRCIMYNYGAPKRRCIQFRFSASYLKSSPTSTIVHRGLFHIHVYYSYVSFSNRPLHASAWNASSFPKLFSEYSGPTQQIKVNMLVKGVCAARSTAAVLCIPVTKLRNEVGYWARESFQVRHDFSHPKTYCSKMNSLDASNP